MKLTIESALRGDHDDELNQRLCEWLGIKPRRRWRFFYDAERHPSDAYEAMQKTIKEWEGLV